MKKLKIKNLSPTPLLIILAVFVFISIPIRVFQLTNCIDPKTGFWAAQDFTALLLYILIIAFAVVAFVLSFFSASMTRPQFSENKDVAYGVFSIVFAATILVQSVLSASSLLSIASTFTVSLENGVSVASLLISNGALSMAFEFIFGLLSSIYFVINAIGALTGSDRISYHRLLGLSPVIWVMARLIYHFVDPINYRYVSQLFLEILLYCFAMVFFLSFARIASGVNESKSMEIIWFTGVLVSLLSFICAGAPLILMITGKGNLIPANYPLNFADLGLALFSTSFLFTVTPLTSEVSEN